MEALVLTPEAETSWLGPELDEPVSPELALIDPELAERARLALPDATLTETRIALRLVASVPEVAPVRPAPSSVEPEQERRAQPLAYDEIRRVLAESPAPVPRAGRRLLRVSVASIVVVGATAAVLVAARDLGRESPSTSAATRLAPTAGASSTTPAAGGKAAPAQVSAPGKKPKPATTARPHGKNPSLHARTGPRRHWKRSHSHALAQRPAQPPIPDFVWAPSKGARSYRVEFRSGSKLVFRTRTRTTRLHVSRSALKQGRYHWLVWRLNGRGIPVGAPLVDATVRIH
jgi:hypothetical protein